MHRNRENLVKRGLEARKFTHSIAGHLSTAIDGIRDACSFLKPENQSIPKGDIIKILEAVEHTLTGLDSISKSLLGDSASQNKSTISVNQLLERVVEHCKPLLERHNITLKLKLLPENCDVFTNLNPDEILEAFDNLVGNAVDALSGTRDPYIWIEANYDQGPDKKLDQATVLLIDNGPGFTKEQRREFSNSKLISSTKHGGLGSGLLITYGCFQANQISMEIIDPPAKLTPMGAAFQLTISLFKPRQIRVFIIDDDIDFLRINQVKAKNSGNAVMEFRTDYKVLLDVINGDKKAIRTLSSFDIILLDCFFPEAPLNDGPDLLKRLKESNPDIAKRVMLMSVKDEYKDRTDVPVLDKSRDVHRNFPKSLYSLLKQRG
jgi:CheY-like chemotaxis protein